MNSHSSLTVDGARDRADDQDQDEDESQARVRSGGGGNAEEPDGGREAEEAEEEAEERRPFSSTSAHHYHHHQQQQLHHQQQQQQRGNGYGHGGGGGAGNGGHQPRAQHEQFSYTLPSATMTSALPAPSSLATTAATQPLSSASPAPVPAPAPALNPLADRSLLCPVCFQVMGEPFITKCGHSFCLDCIIATSTTRQECPVCRSPTDANSITPNYLGRELVSKLSGPPTRQLSSFFANAPLNVQDLSYVIGTLLDKKRRLITSDQEIDLDVLADFLARARRTKQEELDRLAGEIKSISEDLQAVETRRAELVAFRDKVDSDSEGTRESKRPRLESDDNLVKETVDGLLSKIAQPVVSEVFTARKNRVSSFFDDFLSNYFEMRTQYTGRGAPGQAILAFAESMSKFNQHTNMRVLAILRYGDMYSSNTSFVSSMEFDRDNEYFATAGVTKKIKVFDYAAMFNSSSVGIQYPIKEMISPSRISCLSWNHYMKSLIASSDYDGGVCLWDVTRGHAVMQFEEHQKRVWTVDFCKTEPTRLASGSDDGKVKIWTTLKPRSVASFEGQANICSVKFNPENANQLVCGSADHTIHCYDLRKPSEPVMLLKGHKKTVSYVRFLNSEEVVSASTDSTLKLWNMSTGECVRTFTGHVNEKNFVGLTTNNDYIACGSEQNSVYLYQKLIPKPVLVHKFNAPLAVKNGELVEDGLQFVSSVCWRGDSNVLLAANSQGTIKILELCS